MNGKSKSDDPCIICLCEENTHQMRGIDCDCKYYIHQKCHLDYTNNKQKIECPICHTISIDNPFLTGRELYVIKRELAEERESGCVKGCVFGCCCYFVVGAILASVFG